MLPHITTAEQNLVLQEVQKSKDPLLVKYIDKVVAVQTMLHDVLAQLEHGKSVAIRCSDAELVEQVTGQLHQIGLGDFVIMADQHEPVSDYAISNLRVQVKTKKSATKATLTSHYKMQFALQEAMLPYHNLQQKLVGETTVASLPVVIDRKQVESIEQNINIDNIVAAAADISYHQLLGKIHDVANSYQPIFRQLSQSEILNDGILTNIKDERSYSNLVAQVKSLHSDCSNILQRYKRLISKYQTQHQLMLEQRVSNAHTLIKTCLLDVVSGLSSIEKSNVGIMAKLAGKKSATAGELVVSKQRSLNEALLDLSSTWTEHLKSDASTAADLEHYCLDLLAVKHGPSIPATDILRQLSLLNQEDHEWQEVYDSALALVARINDSQLVSPATEINSKALIQQYHLIASVTDQLQFLHDRLERYKSYYQFVAKTVDDELSHTIVEALQYVPTTEWRVTFDQVYYQTQKDKAAAIALPSTNHTSVDLWSMSEGAFSESIENIRLQLCERQLRAVQEIKATNKQLFQSLIKKKLPLQSTASELTTTFAAESRSLFPIHIYTTQVPNVTDQVLYSIGIVGNDGFRLSMLPFTEADFDGTAESSTYVPLYLNHYQYTQPISSLSNSDKIKAAKKLAKLLLALSPNVKIYQAKAANVISLLPYQDDDVLDTALTERGAKSMHLDDVYLQLVESILADARQQTLVIKDGLLSPVATEEILWQHDIIRKYNSAGIATISLYTADQLLTSMHEPILAIADMIMPQTLAAEAAAEQEEPIAVTEATT